MSKAAEDHVPDGEDRDPSLWRKLYVSGETIDLGFRANIHVRQVGRANFEYALLFRDYLRAHPDMARAYAAAKVRLAHHFGADRSAYADAKDPVCDLVMVQARKWGGGS